MTVKAPKGLPRHQCFFHNIRCYPPYYIKVYEEKHTDILRNITAYIASHIFAVNMDTHINQVPYSRGALYIYILSCPLAPCYKSTAIMQASDSDSCSVSSESRWRDRNGSKKKKKKRSSLQLLVKSFVREALEFIASIGFLRTARLNCYQTVYHITISIPINQGIPPLPDNNPSSMGMSWMGHD